MKRIIALCLLLVGAVFFLCLHFGTRNDAEPSPAPAPLESVGPLENGEPPSPSPSPPVGEAPPAPLPPVEVRPPQKTVFQRIADNDTNVFTLSPEQVRAFLARNKTNADSLLAAFNVTHDQDLLREAARRYPSNASVLTAMLGHNLLPDQRRELIERFKQGSPENALANYLSAHEYSENHRPELALGEFVEASTKSGFQDFSVERLQGLEELYLSSGRSAAEAKALAMANLEFPTLGKLRDAGRDLSALERQYAAAGDAASAQMLARMGLGLADKTIASGANSLLSQIVGNSVERNILNGLDANGTYDFLGQSVTDRLAQLQAQQNSIRADARFFDVWLSTANEAQLVSYFDRLKLYGEAAALHWARTQLSDIPQP
jgi:hypothetical protein